MRKIILFAAVLLGGLSAWAQDDDRYILQAEPVGNSDLVNVTLGDGSRQIYRPAVIHWDDDPLFNYRQCKGRYSTAGYVRMPLDPYNPFTAGMLSYLLPGLGHTYDGEPLRGAAFFLGSLLGTTLGASLLSDYYHDVEPDYNQQDGYISRVVGPSTAETTIGVIFLLGSAALYVWNIFDAVKVARVKNLYFRDIVRSGPSLDMEVQPSLGFAPSSGTELRPTAGLALRLSF